jgi:hypothetical protein
MEYFSFKFEGFFRISFSVPWLSDRCSGFRFQFSYEINCGTGIKRIFKKFAIFIVFFLLVFCFVFFQMFRGVPGANLEAHSRKQ